MSAYILAVASIKDADKFGEYGQKAGPTVKKFGGEIGGRGKFVEVLANAEAHSVSAILKFPDVKTAQDWYNSPEYQAIIPLRDEAANFSFVLYEAIG